MTERERWWATATVWMEARGEVFEGQILIALSILGRVGDHRYPNTVGEVVLQPLQYSAWNTNSPTRAALGRMRHDEPSWLTANEAVRIAECRMDTLTERPALHYYNPAVASPSWDTAKTLPRVTIGRHVFVRGVA